MKVTLVTRDWVGGRYVAAMLHEHQVVDRLIVEYPRISWRRYYRRIARVGPANAAFQWWLNRRFQLDAQQLLPASELPPHEAVESINGCEFAGDEIVLGYGTSYVTAATLARLPRGMLNLHTGYLPNYRGVKSEFWVLRFGDADHVGWTLHHMTPELDAGDIVLRQTIPFHREPPGCLRARLLMDAAPAIATYLRALRRSDGRSEPRTPQGAGKYFSSPLLRDWRKT